MKKFMFVFLALILAGTVTPVAYGSALTLTLSPSTLSGQAGSVVGWGYTLNNTSGNFAVVSNSDFCVGAQTPPCTTPLGIYSDFIAAAFVVIAPHTSISDVFNLTNQTGLGSFAIKAGTPAGSILLGKIVLDYDLYADDPALSGGTPVGQDTISADASVSVNAVPEPHSWLLTLAVLPGLYLLRRRAA